MIWELFSRTQLFQLTQCNDIISSNMLYMCSHFLSEFANIFWTRPLKAKKSHVQKCWTPCDTKKLSMAEPGFSFSSHLQPKICSKKGLKESTISPVISCSTKWIWSITKALVSPKGFSFAVQILIKLICAFYRYLEG